MPAVASNVHRFLRNVSRESMPLTRHCWRVVSWEVSPCLNFNINLRINQF